ncbi:MAG: energy transducer TonB, partial [bacterium]|nr:energy transducer TonB [bacterium]
MKNALLLSFSLHIVVLGVVPLFALFQKEKPDYPVSAYQVSIMSLPGQTVSTAFTEKTENSAEDAIKTGKKDSKKSEKSEKTKGSKSGFGYKGKFGNISTQGDFKYSYYLETMMTKIIENFRNPYEGESGKISAVVSFVIKRDGEIDRIKLTTPSGNYYFDQAALGALYATRKLPPLPEEFKKAELYINFEF